MQNTPFGQVLIREIETFDMRLSQYKLLRLKAKSKETEDGVPEHLKKDLDLYLDDIKICVFQIQERLTAAAKQLRIEGKKISELNDLSNGLVEQEYPEIETLNKYSSLVNGVYAAELSGVQNTGKLKDLTT